MHSVSGSEGDWIRVLHFEMWRCDRFEPLDSSRAARTVCSMDTTADPSSSNASSKSEVSAAPVPLLTPSTRLRIIGETLVLLGPVLSAVALGVAVSELFGLRPDDVSLRTFAGAIVIEVVALGCFGLGSLLSACPKRS